MNYMSPDNKWIGKPTIRPDGIEKVTGSAQYAADYTMPGMVWGKVLRSPHAHALIKKIDTSKAEALQGVLAVMTGADLPTLPLDVPLPTGPNDIRWISRGCMAQEKILYVGHPIAAVAATSQEIAIAALDLIEVDYEVLPHVIDVDEAVAPGAPILHDWIKTEGIEGPTNISNIMTVKTGDVEKGFDEADLVVERDFKSAAVHQGYLEPQSCVVSYKPDSQSTIWSSSQGQFMVRGLTATITGMATGDIKAIPAEIGGGFGGKTIIYLEPVAMVLSKKCGRPVKMQNTREEVFHSTGPAPGMSAHLKVGVTKEGKLTAVEGSYNMQAGCYPGSPVGRACHFSFSCYDIPNANLKGLDIVSNRPNVAAYRAPGPPTRRARRLPPARRVGHEAARRAKVERHGRLRAIHDDFVQHGLGGRKGDGARVAAVAAAEHRAEGATRKGAAASPGSPARGAASTRPIESLHFQCPAIFPYQTQEVLVTPVSVVVSCHFH
mgnify:CR=1 FL=1